MHTCESCGNTEPDGARFCGECGAALEAPAAVLSSEPPYHAATAVASAPTLVVEAPAVAATLPPVAVASPPIAQAPRRRRRWPVVAAFVVMLGGGAAVLLVSGVIPPHHGRTTLADADFWRAANGHAALDLGAVDRTAQDDVSVATPTEESNALYDDGATMASYAAEAADELRALTGLTAAQTADRRVLQTLIASNRTYAIALEGYARQNVSLDDLQSAATAVGAAARVAASVLPSEAQLPSEGVFVLAAPAPPVTATPSTPTDVGTPGAYVEAVDVLLNDSHRTLTAVKAFAPAVANGQLDNGSAVVEINRIISARQRQLDDALRLAAPAGFATVQALLVRSLRLSLQDDEALAGWVNERGAGGNSQAALDDANAIGAQATLAKKRFIAAYARLRQAATGKTAASLPNGY